MKVALLTHWLSVESASTHTWNVGILECTIMTSQLLKKKNALLIECVTFL